MRSLNRVIVLLIAAGQIAGCGGANTSQVDQPEVKQTNAPSGQTEGHRKMLEVLAQIRDRAPVEHQYYGRGTHIRKREQVANLPPDTDPFVRLKEVNSLGYLELLYEPSPQFAIDTLSLAYKMLPNFEYSGPGEKKTEANRTRFFLAVAYLRLGETENCCLRNNSESCILPIRGNGVHTQEEGSRQAIKYFLEVLNDTVDSTGGDEVMLFHEASRWLMNIAYMTLGEWPDKVPPDFLIPPKYFESDIEFPQFENVMPKLNLDTFNAAGGAIVDDFDNDNYLDIFYSSSDPTLNCGFFRNNRDGTFTDRTKEAGLIGLLGGLNMVQADYNNDGNLDVFILRGAWHGKYGRHPNSLLRNNGDGTFTDVSFDAGLGKVHHPKKSAGWADYDLDGDLDIFIANEAEYERAIADGRDPVYAPSQLFRNNGDETFTDVALEAGVNVETFAAGCSWGDFNQDRFPDLFISGAPKGFLFQNDGDGTFTDVTQAQGIALAASPFATWFWDFDNDGILDLYVTSSAGPIGIMGLNAVAESSDSGEQRKVRLARVVKSPNLDKFETMYEMPSLFRGQSGGGFKDVAREQKLAYPTQPMGSNFGDLNGDGFLDFYLATGNVPYWDLWPNLMFLNLGGTGFANVTMAGRFGHLQKGHGVSFADIDNDGDQDVYVQTGGQLPGDRFNDALFENPGFGHHWITLKLIGKQSNRSAIGTRIHVTVEENGQSRSIYRHVNSGGSFGCNPLRQNIGLGKADRIESITIEWPRSNTTQVFRDVKLDQQIEIVEGANDFTIIDVKRNVLGGSVD